MEKQECLVLETSSRLHDDQSLEIQLEGLPSRGDQRCIQKLENLILQLFENEVINAMQHEAELISKSDIFDETWLFGYIPLSNDVKYARNLRVRIQGVHLYLSPWKLESCHILAFHIVYFPQPVNGFV